MVLDTAASYLAHSLLFQSEANDAIKLLSILADPNQDLFIQTLYTGFCYFSNLPPEIRYIIWQLTFPTVSRPFMFLLKNPKPILNRNRFQKFIKPPIASAVDRESRHILLKTFKKFPQTYYDMKRKREFGPGNALAKKYLFFRPKVDTLHVAMAPLVLGLLLQHNKKLPTSPYIVPVDWPTIFRDVEILTIEGQMLMVPFSQILEALRKGMLQLFDSLKVVRVQKGGRSLMALRRTEAEYCKFVVALTVYFQERNQKDPRIEVPYIELCECRN